MTALALCRFAHFIAAMLTFGMSAYLWAYAPERLTLALSPIVRRLALIASLVALITAIAWLALESASMADDWTAALDPSLIGAVLTDTAFGPAWAAHLVLAATLVAVVVFGPRARWAATAIASAALLASLGLVGHAAMQTGGEGVLHRANHALHLLTTGAWVGGLVPFAMCLRAYRRDDLRRESVQAMAGFSFWGQFIVVAIILTGLQPKASGRGASTNSPAVGSSALDADGRAAIERVVISRTTIEIELAEGMAERRSKSHPDHPLDAAVAPPSPRDHPRRGRTAPPPRVR